MESSGARGGKLGKSAFDMKPMGELKGNKDVSRDTLINNLFDQLMGKKIKANSKYANIKSVISHGKTTKDVDILSDNLVAKRKGENYGRVKCSTLAKFLTEFSTSETVFDLMRNNTNGGDDFDAHNKENSDSVSQTGSVVSCADSVVTCTTEMLGITAETKFVLLDLREEEEYKKWHLKESINFPAPNINRDKQFGQLLRFKNIPDKLIVVYTADEKFGTHYAKILHEKGFDNVYLLSGGAEKFLESYPDLVEGTNVPEVKKPAAANQTSKSGGFKKVAATTATSAFKNTTNSKSGNK